MKDLVGKTVVIGVDGKDIRGEVIADYPDRLIVAQPNGKDLQKTLVAVIIKAKMTFFMVSEDKSLDELKKLGSNCMGVPVTVLTCWNKNIKCNGVRYFTSKSLDGDDKVSKEDYELFMKPCPKKQKTCKCGPMGPLLEIPTPTLVDILNGAIIGDYPE